MIKSVSRWTAPQTPNAPPSDYEKASVIVQRLDNSIKTDDNNKSRDHKSCWIEGQRQLEELALAQERVLACELVGRRRWK